MKLCNSNTWTNILTFIYRENVARTRFDLIFYCDCWEFNLTSGFFIFLFMVTDRNNIYLQYCEGTLKVLNHKNSNQCISQGFQVGYEWSEFKIFSRWVSRNIFLKSKWLLIALMLFKILTSGLDMTCEQ